MTDKTPLEIARLAFQVAEISRDFERMQIKGFVRDTMHGKPPTVEALNKAIYALEVAAVVYVETKQLLAVEELPLSIETADDLRRILESIGVRKFRIERNENKVGCSRLYVAPENVALVGAVIAPRLIAAYYISVHPESTPV